jgi:hypothetical protein
LALLGIYKRPFYNGGFSKESIDELVEALDSNYLMVGAITCDYGNPERPEQELKK